MMVQRMEIMNTGSCALYLSSGTFDYEDASGSLVATESLVSVYPEVINPGEKAYYYDVSTLDNVKLGDTLKIVPKINAEQSAVDTIRLPTSDVKLSSTDYGTLNVIGRVENNTSQIQNMIYVTVFLYDPDGVFIGLLFTIISDDLAPGEKIGFETSLFLSRIALLLKA
jgi:hypothetical protein